MIDGPDNILLINVPRPASFAGPSLIDLQLDAHVVLGATALSQVRRHAVGRTSIRVVPPYGEIGPKLPKCALQLAAKLDFKMAVGIIQQPKIGPAYVAPQHGREAVDR